MNEPILIQSRNGDIKINGNFISQASQLGDILVDYLIENPDMEITFHWPQKQGRKVVRGPFVEGRQVFRP